MSENSIKARRLWEEIFPTMNLESVAEIIAADSIDHSARPGEPQGIDGVRSTMRFLDGAFSDQSYEVHRTVEEGDTVVVHLTHRGRHTGEIMGIAPTNRQFAYDHIHILRFKGGKAVEHWGIHDLLSFLQQVGAMPPRREAAAH
ncbi:MAG TPA: ester cyclase [Actinomycetota bacterium]|nr:ester cyclase [Actinomycetota bacterium]